MNVELALATLQETVTVSGASPVIDTSTTRVQQNFKMEQLQSIPNGRDMWALLAVTPSVQMGRIDVGGNRAGTQTGYTAYGMNGQVRVLIEGINTTEGTGGAGFYFDYASLEEAFLGTSGQSAEMPNPGVQSQFIARSGSNQFQAEYHLDWYNNALQGSNIPDEYTQPTAFNNSPIRAHSNEIDRYYDHDINAGGPIVRTRRGSSAPTASSSTPWRSRTSSSTAPSTPSCGTPVGKATYQINQKNKLIGYYQWGQKEQPNRLPFASYTYDSPEQTFKQDSGSWVYKAEWNGTISDKLYLEAPLRRLRLLLPALHQQPRELLLARHRPRHLARRAPEAAARSRPQAVQRRRRPTSSTPRRAATPSSSAASCSRSCRGKASNRAAAATATSSTIYSNGASTQVIFGLPTAIVRGRLARRA